MVFKVIATLFTAVFITVGFVIVALMFYKLLRFVFAFVKEVLTNEKY